MFQTLWWDFVQITCYKIKPLKCFNLIVKFLIVKIEGPTVQADAKRDAIIITRYFNNTGSSAEATVRARKARRLR